MPNWTSDMTDKLRELWATGKSATEIGESLSRHFGEPFSRNAVIGKVHRLKLQARPSPIIHKAKPEAQEAAAKPQVWPSSDHDCRWPMREIERGQFEFCCNRREAGKPYCAEHCGIAFQKPEPKEKKKGSYDDGRPKWKLV